MITLLKHDCPTPLSMPVVEEQRVWTCPDCSTQWRWDRTGHDSIGWVRGERESQPARIDARHIKCDADACVRCWGHWGVSDVPYPDEAPTWLDRGWGPKERPDATLPWYWWLTRKRRMFLHWWRLQWW